MSSFRALGCLFLFLFHLSLKIKKTLQIRKKKQLMSFVLLELVSDYKLLVLIESCRFWLMLRTSLTTDL